MRSWPRVLVVFIPLALGCEGPLFERSCAGEAVALCRPYEHSIVTEASIEPAELPVADFSLDARIRVELERCPDAPAPHVVDVLAIAPGGITTSLVTLRDGRDGDLIEGDGVIDVTITNPLLVTVPARTDIVLRFTPRSMRRDVSDPLGLGCSGESFDLPYRTGPSRPMSLIHRRSRRLGGGTNPPSARPLVENASAFPPRVRTEFGPVALADARSAVSNQAPSGG